MKKIIVILMSLVLLAGIISGCVEEKKKKETTTNNAPVAMFSFSKDNMNVTFTDESTDEDENDTLTWSWDFDGDGEEDSTEQNPEYTYANNGIYTITLIVSDGTDIDEYFEEITIGTPPTAGITPPEGNITVNTSAEFMDASTKGDSNITSWSWDFGDEMTSTDQNPTHNYTAVGTYTVTLTVSDDDGLTDTTTVDVTIKEA
jgi:PKD repeat protein